MNTLLQVGTRSSPLALKQVKEIQSLFYPVQFVAVPIDTMGDKDKITPLYKVEGTDFFTREIDQVLLRGDIDLAVHSSKDLSDPLPDGLKIVFESGSLSPYDALVSKGNLKLKDLPAGSRLGISSLRRKNQIQAVRKDLRVIDIRGNIQERLDLIEKDKVDALIIAEAALIRLGLEGKIAEVFKQPEFQAHPKQGKLAIVVREDRWQEVKSILSEQARATGN